MGMASSKSRPLPCGTPSMMSIKTTSASSFDAIQCAAVAPTLPEPTMLTFFRMSLPLRKIKSLQPQRSQRIRKVREENLFTKRLAIICESFATFAIKSFLYGRQHASSHIFDNVVCELAGADLRGTRHQPFEIVRY